MNTNSLRTKNPHSNEQINTSLIAIVTSGKQDKIVPIRGNWPELKSSPINERCIFDTYIQRNILRPTADYQYFIYESFKMAQLLTSRGNTLFSADRRKFAFNPNRASLVRDNCEICN